MRWTSKEIDVYLSAKEYIDTVFITLVPISIHSELKQTVSMGEFSSILTNEVERQLHGRTLVIPPFTYFKNESHDEKFQKLFQWIKEIKDNGFRYVFLFTSDNEWKLIEDKLDATLIWLPAIPLEHMDDKYKSEILHDQTKQILQIVTNQWQNET